STLAGLQRLHIIDQRMAVAALIEVLPRITPGIEQFAPGPAAGVDLLRQADAGGGAIGDAPRAKPGGNVQAGSLLRIRFTDVGHAVRGVVILVAPAPDGLSDR